MVFLSLLDLNCVEYGRLLGPHTGSTSCRDEWTRRGRLGGGLGGSFEEEARILESDGAEDEGSGKCWLKSAWGVWDKVGGCGGAR